MIVIDKLTTELKIPITPKKLRCQAVIVQEHTREKSKFGPSPAM